MYVGSHVVGGVGVIGDLAGLQLQTGCVGCRPWQVSCMDPDYYVVGRPGVGPGFSEGGGGLMTARRSGVCPLPRKAEKLLPLMFVTNNK